MRRRGRSHAGLAMEVVGAAVDVGMAEVFAVEARSRSGSSFH